MGKKNDFMEKCWARYRPMIYLAGFSGMRPSEYRGLPWSNVYEDRVKVRQRADKTGIIGPVKSRAGRRTIYLPYTGYRHDLRVAGQVSALPNLISCSRPIPASRSFSEISEQAHGFRS